ncbi:hypothetical protein LTR91_017105 [Friedmanniomyces endolithicus]|uniref:Protein kinase domain-containing protein n=1 Tax=Friedmanniomyces endolithicus TaxID=329885 RepID=A0A4U0UYB1_9PEZI|nr:hypothetical protein LTS09_007445 [Friedmanniomyces endolithicus]KAK0910430.1 hypothetical protein LTR57_015871 [Friedmanniomyces endolithicus]KAK0967508.1 hypothetical protein LTR91_017105 [Friedmanniomyces endolithicus]KAK1006028.1 hypothetical protein LTS01_003104 [Friedmanniomyces endolithicus]KAK1049012.1 hypothetical protein LTS16_004120 [Friedmanniomyces endolithicus]
MADGGVGIAGLVLGIPGLIDLCVKYGDFLRTKCSNYRHITEISRLYELIATLVMGEMSDLLQFFKSIESRLSVSTRDDVMKMFQVLRDKLESVLAILPDDKPGAWDKLKFAFHDKKLLDGACKDLEQWQSRFLRRAVTFLFFGDLSTSGETNPTARQDRVTARIKRIRSAIIDEDPGTALAKLQLQDFSSSTTFKKLDRTEIVVVEDWNELVEYRRYGSSAGPKEVNSLLRTVRDFATRLHSVDPVVMGLLKCKGFSNDAIGHKLALRFEYPTGKDNPRTLEHLLIDKQAPKHSMSNRVALASKLASAVLYLHSCDFVHKNIRPSNVLVFDDAVPHSAKLSHTTHPYVIGEPYLVGFDSVRKADARSNMIRVEEWKKNIYLHPDRHRMQDGDEFTMVHDVYSLGVVLLEVALWSSMTELGSIGKALWASLEKGKERILEPEKLREKFIELAKYYIPRCIGDKYRDVVVSCLEGLKDEEESRLLEDRDGIVIGSAYISQIMSKLEDISI